MPETPIKLNLVGNLPGESSDSTLVVASDADYCEASEILRARNPNGISAIWVRQQHHFAWLKSQFEIFGDLRDESVTITKTTPRILLGERWKVEVPDWLTDELVLDYNLLDEELPDGCTRVVDGLLSSVFGQLSEKLQARSIGSLAEKASSPEVSAKLADPLLKTAWESVLDGWNAPGAPAWIAGFCKRLSENPTKLWSDLTAWRLLGGYPESALDYALDPSAASFVRGLPSEATASMHLSPEGKHLALDQINQVLAGLGGVVATRQRFENLTAAVSGELVEEFDALEELLGRAAFEVSQDDVEDVRRRFADCDGVSDTRLDRLVLLVPPPVPDEMDSAESDADAWRQWALDQYLPYRWWQIQRRSADAALEKSVASFSSWYCSNYAVVHADPEASSIQALGRWREAILADRVSLILLVDNLPWFFWDMLEKALSKAGLHRHSSGYSFAPLPSHTSVCKPQLVSGKPSATGSDYSKLMQNRSDDEWQGRAVHYLFAVDQLAQLPATGEPYVALLNYLAADEALHRDAEAEGSTWTEQLNLLFGNLAKAVGEFAKRVTKGGKDFGLYLVTDHGATMILPEERTAADAQLTKKLFPNEKYRSATLSPAEADQIPANLWSLGHRLESPLSNDVHFIPKGHNTVASGGQRLTFSHGGATPEEVLVPSGLFRLYSAAWSAPKVRFINLDLTGGKARFYIKRIVALEVEIQNSNGDPCRLEGVQVLPAVGDLRHFDQVLIPAHGSAKSSVSLYFSEAALTTEQLTITLDLRIGQDALPVAIELPVTITSATSGGIDLKNLLS